jgi:hypothetical protein
VVFGAIGADITDVRVMLDVVTAANRRVLARVNRIVARALVENDLETRQGGDSRWRQGSERLDGGLVSVDNKVVGRIQQGSDFGVQDAAGLE